MAYVAAARRRFTRARPTWTRYARRTLHCAVLAALTLAAVLVAPQTASACMCADNSSPCALAATGSAIFLGTVLDPAPSTPPSATDRPSLERPIRIAVSEVFSGPGHAGDTVTVLTPDSDGTCGFPFQAGVEYLIYAQQDGAALYVTQCSRTNVAASAGEELALLRELKAGHPVSRLTGSLALMATLVQDGHLAMDFLRPEPGTPATARGANDARYETTLDDTGHFIFRGLPPGDYTLGSGLPEMMRPIYGPPRVSLDACSANEDIVVSFIGIWGTVRTQAGDPAKGVRVTIAAVDASGRVGGEDLSVTETTDAAGEYEVVGLVPGRYAVGVNAFDVPSANSPYPPFWVTAPDAPALPRVFDVTDKPPTIVDINLPSPLPTATLTGRVVGTSGFGTVGMLEVRDLGDTPSFVGGATVDAEGRFSVTVLTGRRYRLTATGPRQAPGRGTVDTQVDSATPAPVVIRLSPD